MTFVLAFYSFNLEITNSEAGVYHKVRVKIPRHPQEALTQMYARVLAFSHSYEEGLEFSRGLFETREPSLWKRNILEEVEAFIEVGEIDQEKLRRALKRSESAHFRIYFYEEDQISQFCHAMRGSTTNWIENISFFLIPRHLLDEVSGAERSSSSWSCTFVDETLYLTVDGRPLEGNISKLDMWAKYQESLEAGVA